MTTPDRLGKYEIRSTLGRGAMGVVYEGWDPVISRRVAIKTVRLPDSTDAEAQEELARFKREAQAAGRLNHPNVVGVFDYNETAELAYIVMEFVEGQTLKGVIGEHEHMAMPMVSRILSDVLDGLAYCHERGVVHRDIKPANIMITPEGQAKIADFGIARIESSSMTQAGTVLGTPAYMSPEQFMGVIVDARTDIYSTGVLMFQLLTGDRPFEGSMTTIMHKVLNTVPPKPSELSVTVPRSLDEVVMRAMARRPEDRFANAGAFKQAMVAALAAPQAMADPLADLLGDGPEDGTVIVSKPKPPPLAANAAPPQAAAVPPPAKKSRAPLFASLAAIVLVAGGAGAYFVTRPQQTPPLVVADRETPRSDASPTTKPAGPVAETTPTRPVDPPVVKPVAEQSKKPDLPPIQDVRPVAPTDVAVVRPPAPTGTVTPPTSTATGGMILPPTPSTTQIQASIVPPSPVTPGITPGVTPGVTSGVSPPPPTTLTRSDPTTTVATNPSQTPTPQTSAPQTPPAQSPTGQTAAKPPPEVLAPVDPPARTAMLSPAMLRPALASALASTSCSFTTGTLNAQGVANVQGVASGPALAAMHQAAEAAAPGVRIEWAVADVDPVFCETLDLLHSLAPEFGSPPAITLTLQNSKTSLVTDDYIIPHVVMPATPAYLAVDYLVHDGTVSHLYPNKDDPVARDFKRQFSARAQVKIGEKQGSFVGWQVWEPYGRDLIVAITSSAPLLGIRPIDPKTGNEPTAPYLSALKSAIDAARKSGARITADVLVLETAPKAP